MPYLLDTGCFIQAKNAHYGFRLCPGYWEWLLVAHEQGLVYSIDGVLEELLAVGQLRSSGRVSYDELAEWARARGPDFFLPPTSSSLYAYQQVSEWASSSERFTDAAINEFLAKADSMLVAEGRARGYVVVTHERAAPNRRNKVKIPDACSDEDIAVECISPFEMLNQESVTFVLAESSV